MFVTETEFETMKQKQKKWSGKGCCIILPDGCAICAGEKWKAEVLRNSHNQSMSESVGSGEKRNTET